MKKMGCSVGHSYLGGFFCCCYSALGPTRCLSRYNFPDVPPCTLYKQKAISAASKKKEKKKRKERERIRPVLRGEIKGQNVNLAAKPSPLDWTVKRKPSNDTKNSLHDLMKRRPSDTMSAPQHLDAWTFQTRYSSSLKQIDSGKRRWRCSIHKGVGGALIPALAFHAPSMYREICSMWNTDEMTFPLPTTVQTCHAKN